MRIGIVAVLAWVMAGASGTVAAAERVPIEAFARFKEGHGFYSEDNNIAFYRTLEAFIDRHIGAASGTD